MQQFRPTVQLKRTLPRQLGTYVQLYVHGRQGLRPNYRLHLSHS